MRLGQVVNLSIFDSIISEILGLRHSTVLILVFDGVTSENHQYRNMTAVSTTCYLRRQGTQATTTTTTKTISKNNRFIDQNNSSARASLFLVHFFDVHCSTTTSKLLIQFDILWTTWTYDDEFSFLFLNLNKIHKNSRFVEDVNTRQQLSSSFSELRYC